MKPETMSPTGSFKDQGASVLATALRGLGIQRAVAASSGNAGVSWAAYAARAGIACELCVPSTVDTPKQALAVEPLVVMLTGSGLETAARPKLEIDGRKLARHSEPP